MIITDKSKLITKCNDVSIFEAGNIIEKLKKELFESGIESGIGVGLSSNQIGINARICVAKISDGVISLVNPVIVDAEDKRLFFGEGCLSFPGDIVTTVRFNEILVQDSLHKAGIVFVGAEAVIIQHELNHLEGKTMFDFEVKVPGRNEDCWCGSERKYKNCCIGKVIN